MYFAADNGTHYVDCIIYCSLVQSTYNWYFCGVHVVQSMVYSGVIVVNHVDLVCD